MTSWYCKRYKSTNHQHNTNGNTTVWEKRHVEWNCFNWKRIPQPPPIYTHHHYTHHHTTYTHSHSFTPPVVIVCALLLLWGGAWRSLMLNGFVWCDMVWWIHQAVIQQYWVVLYPNYTTTFLHVQKFTGSAWSVQTQFKHSTMVPAVVLYSFVNKKYRTCIGRSGVDLPVKYCELSLQYMQAEVYKKCITNYTNKVAVLFAVPYCLVGLLTERNKTHVWRHVHASGVDPPVIHQYCRTCMGRHAGVDPPRYYYYWTSFYERDTRVTSKWTHT